MFDELTFAKSRKSVNQKCLSYREWHVDINGNLRMFMPFYNEFLESRGYFVVKIFSNLFCGLQNMSDVECKLFLATELEVN